MPDRWYVAKAKPLLIPFKFTGPVVPHPFTYALRNLHNQGFETYCPTQRERWIYRGKRREREREKAIFKSYLFVQLNLHDQQWRKSTRRAASSTSCRFTARNSIRVAVGFVETLQARAAEEAAVAEEICRTFRENTIVRILAGALQGRLGRVLSSSRRQLGSRSNYLAARLRQRLGPMLEEVDRDC
jgi:hypothetical protein